MFDSVPIPLRVGAVGSALVLVLVAVFFVLSKASDEAYSISVQRLSGQYGVTIEAPDGYQTGEVDTWVIDGERRECIHTLNPYVLRCVTNTGANVDTMVELDRP